MTATLRSLRSALAVSAVVLAVMVPVPAPIAAAPPAGHGELRVTTAPAVPSVISVDGVVRDVWGLTWLDIEAGDHEVCFSDVLGHRTPDCETVTVPDGGTGTVEGEFIPLASLQVTTSPPLPATITLNGIPRDDWGVFSWIPTTADVEVCFGPVADHQPPPCQTIAAGTTAAGEVAQVTGTYTADPGAPGPSGTGSLRVTTTPALPASIRVDGIRRDDWGLDWLQLPPGTYEVCFSDVAGYITPDCQTAQIAEGQTTTVDGSFTELSYIRASTEPAWEATVVIDGVVRNDWGAWPPVEAGPHQVCFTDGGAPAACWDIFVSEGETYEVVGTPPLADPVTQVATGSLHTCALQLSGKVSCWGFNTSGALGDGSTTTRSAPAPVVGIDDAIAIGSADRFSCALRQGGEVWCWGNNDSGQLGDGTTTTSTVPVQVSGITDAHQLTVGHDHACARVGAIGFGALHCWGENEYGQLGDGTTTDRTTPVEVSGLLLATSAAAGGGTTCAVRVGGSVLCWGRNDEGQLGVGDTTGRLTPTLVGDLPPATSVTVGLLHTCAVVVDDDLWCWGSNSHGQLGTGEVVDSSPIPVLTLAENVTTASASDRNTCATAPADGPRCWGHNDWGQLGAGSPYSFLPVPVWVHHLASTTQVDVATTHVCAVDAGRAYCWGRDLPEIGSQDPEDSFPAEVGGF